MEFPRQHFRETGRRRDQRLALTRRVAKLDIAPQALERRSAFPLGAHD
jgi:hypothetical protein